MFERLLEKLRDFWNVENELRRAAQQGALLRKKEAGGHLSRAREHFDRALDRSAKDANSIERQDR